MNQTTLGNKFRYFSKNNKMREARLGIAESMFQ